MEIMEYICLLSNFTFLLLSIKKPNKLQKKCESTWNSCCDGDHILRTFYNVYLIYLGSRKYGIFLIVLKS